MTGLSIQEILLCGFALALCIAINRSPYFLDYPAYVDQWKTVLNAPNELSKLGTNAYGPTHILFSYVYAISPGAPRIAFSLIWITGGFFLLRRCSSQRMPAWIPWSILLFLYINPYFLRLYAYGQNDLAVSGLLLLSIMCHRTRQDTLAGALFALSTSYKFYPIVIIPLLILDYTECYDRKYLKQIRWRFLISFIVVTGVLLAWSHWLLGPSFSEPYSFLTSREPTESSLAYFLLHVLKMGFLNDAGFRLGGGILVAFIFVAISTKLPRYKASIIALVILFVFSPVFYYVYIIGTVALLFENTTARYTPGASSLLVWRAPIIYMGLMLSTFALIELLSRINGLPLIDYKGGIYAFSNITLLCLLIGDSFNKTISVMPK